MLDKKNIFDMDADLLEYMVINDEFEDSEESDEDEFEDSDDWGEEE